MQRVLLFFKRFILSIFILYGYNLIAINFNCVVPINIFSILFTVVLGIPGMISLILFKLLVL